MTPDDTAERRVQSIAETFATYHETLAARVRAGRRREQRRDR
jgi:hypothetical protein